MSSLKIEARKHRRPLAVDLFSGAGGMSLGFEQAGFDVVAAAEIDPVHSATHEYNFPRCASICADASMLTPLEIRRAADIGTAPIDVVFGGAPCQGFSMIGKRALDDSRNRLLVEFARLTAGLKANYFVFENVRGITIGRHKQLLDEFIDVFQSGGYEVKLPYQVLNASNFGVPQDRQRLFLIGARKGLPLPTYPATSRSPQTTVWDAIGDLPDVDQFDELLDSDTIGNVRFGKPSAYAKLLRGMEEEESDFSYPRRWDRSKLTSSMRTIHTPLSQERFSTTPQGKVEAISRFLKLDPKGLCNTLRAGTGSDRGAFTSPRPVHPRSPRCITVREAARLHSYPDWFRFHATKWHGFRQVGNSVPPLLARAVASTLIEAMQIQPLRPQEELSLGDERLLTMTVTEAARHYGVSRGVVGRRLRPSDVDQLTLAIA